MYLNQATDIKDIYDLKEKLDSQSLKSVSFTGMFDVGKSFIIKLLSGA